MINFIAAYMLNTWFKPNYYDKRDCPICNDGSLTVCTDASAAKPAAVNCSVYDNIFTEKKLTSNLMLDYSFGIYSSLTASSV